MVTFSGGAFLVAFALKLGASNLIIGLLSAIPPLMQLLQIPSIYLIEKIRNRRSIVVYSGFLHRLAILLTALIPFIDTSKWGLFLLVTSLFLQGAFLSTLMCAWNSWMRDLVPGNQLGSYFSKRMRLMTAFGLPISLLAGWFIDFYKDKFPQYEIYGYSVLFFLGFIAGLTGVYFLSKTEEPKMMDNKEKLNWIEMIKMPFKDENYRKLLFFLGSWNFAINLSAPFFTVYLLMRLKLDMILVISFTVLSQIMYFIFLKIWGRISDHLSNKSVLSLSGPLFIICILGWTFTTMPEKYWATIPLLVLLHILMGISTAGVNLSSSNIALKLAPNDKATSYLAVNSFISSIAAGIAPILGGTFADFFARRELSLVFKWKSPARELLINTMNFQYWDFFFILSFMIGLYALHRLARVKEVGEVGEKVVINEFFSEIAFMMKNLSTADGLRQMVIFPFSHLKHIARDRYRRNKRKKISHV